MKRYSLEALMKITKGRDFDHALPDETDKAFDAVEKLFFIYYDNGDEGTVAVIYKDGVIPNWSKK